MSILLVIAITLAVRSIISIVVLWNVKDKDEAMKYLSLGVVGMAFNFIYTVFHILKDYRSGRLQPYRTVFEPKDGFNFNDK